MFIAKKPVPKYAPVILVIIDGWGIAPAADNNPFFQATDSTLRDLTSQYRTFALEAPHSVDGSEIGHTMLSAGRPVSELDQGVLSNCLPEAISHADMRQFYVAETKKYGYLTYYFNGRSSTVFPNVKTQLVEANHVAGYKFHPRMQTPEIASQIISKVSQGWYAFFATNLPNIDMVAHTGDLKLTCAAVNHVSRAVRKIVDVALSCGGVVVLAADHGNAERVEAKIPGQSALTHTNNPVPCCIVGQDFAWSAEEVAIPLHERPVAGSIARVAPTILSLLGIAQPPEMTEKSLLI